MIIITLDAHNDSYLNARKRKIGWDSDHVSSLAQEFSSRDVSPSIYDRPKRIEPISRFVEAVESRDELFKTEPL